MTQKEAFELIKQTVLECKGNLEDIFISFYSVMYRYAEGFEETEISVSVQEGTNHIVRSESVGITIAKIKSYYGITEATFTTNGELPNLAS